MLWSIYCIENKVNGKKYVGQTIKSIEHRFECHVYSSRRANASLLSKAIRKHGVENFVVSLVCQVETQEEADAKEIELIALLQTRDRSKGYNIAIGGVSNVLTGLHMSEETRKKISAAHKGKKLTDDHRRLISKVQLGNKKRLGKMHSDETKQKIRESLTGRKLTEEQCAVISERMNGHVLSPEARAKISAANRGRKHTEEARRKNAEAHRGKKTSPETIEKLRAALTGRTRPEDVCRKISEGLKGKPGLQGEDNGSSKLTEDQVREIKRLFAEGARNIDVMKQFGMSKGAIANIKSGRSWSHVILNTETTR